LQHAPPSRQRVDGPQQAFEQRLLAARDLVRPGFMTLRPVRVGKRIVDFVWVFASAKAGRMLGHNAVDLYGRRLLVVLADQEGCESVFRQYRSVVELGAAAATQRCTACSAATTPIAMAPCAWVMVSR
jgi:hypothetical protein